MLVQLILAKGSRAGTIAQIQTGYYMIGRHDECQIRPKSRSVSRRHCLVHHAPNGVRLLDLQSTSGTRLNDEKLEPLQWVDVSSGDQIRCGKVAFDVAIDATDGKAAPSMVQGEAWQEFDIANFLEAQDNVDREKRYQDIRSRLAEDEDDFGEDGLEEESIDADSDDIDAVTGAAAGTGKSSAEMPAKATTKAEPARRFGKLPRRPSAARSWDLDFLKLIAAVIVTIVVLAFFVYKLVEFRSPPDVQVIEGID